MLNIVILYISLFFIFSGIALRAVKAKVINANVRSAFIPAVLGIAFWLFCNGMVQLVTSPKSIWFWHELKFVAICYIPSSFIHFTLVYVKKEKLLIKPLKVFLIVFPTIMLLLVFTNSFHHGFRLNYEVQTVEGLTVVNTTNGIFFWINAMYCYLSLLITGVFMWIYYRSVPKFYKVQPLLLLIALSLPSIVNVSFVFNWINEPYDFTSITFALTGMLFYISLFHFKTPDIIPIARNLVMDNLSDIILILNNENEVLDVNKRTTEFLNESNITLEGIHFEQLTNKLLSVANGKVIKQNDEIIYEIETVNGKEYFKYNRFPIDDDGYKLGDIVKFSNHTNNYLMLKKLEKMATTDALTKLYNRAYFNEFLKLEYDEVGIIYGGINGFKVLNEDHGTEFCDYFLIRVGLLLSEYIKEDCIVGRYEGDEFVVLLPNTSKATCDLKAIEIKEAIEKIVIQGTSITICIASIHTEDQLKPTELIKRAKKVMDRKKLTESNSSKSALVESLRRALEQSDYETKQHTDRTTALAKQIGDKINLDEQQMNDIAMLAALHDIGKIAIPDAILLKPGKLTNDEFEIMKTHTLKGYSIAMASPELTNIADGILHHHEKWDGTGYPDGLKGDDISIEARIITLVDAYDVMTNDRPYKTAMTKEDAIIEVKRCKGTHFDPNLVDVLLEILA